jgi:PAS domain-containing protein
MQLTAEYAERVERRLRFAFLLNQAVQRNAERVTATEITVLVEEIENALGGVYSMLSHEMMEWRLGRLLFNLQRKGVIPVWPDGDITPRVLTGLEALSRDRDVSRVTTAAELIKMFGEPAMEVIEITDLLRQAFIGLGLQDVTLSRDEIEKRQEMKARLEAMVKAIPQAIAGQQQQ